MNLKNSIPASRGVNLMSFVGSVGGIKGISFEKWQFQIQV